MSHVTCIQNSVDLSLNVSVLPLEWSPGQVYDIAFDVTVPPYSSLYGMVDVSLPVNESAVMTLVEITLVSLSLILCRYMGGKRNCYDNKSDTAE